MCCEHVLCLYWSLYSFVIVFVIIQTIVIMYAHINKKYTVHMILMYSTNYRYYSNSGFDHVCIFQFFPLLFLLLKVFDYCAHCCACSTYLGRHSGHNPMSRVGIRRGRTRRKCKRGNSFWWRTRCPCNARKRSLCESEVSASQICGPRAEPHTTVALKQQVQARAGFICC